VGTLALILTNIGSAMNTTWLLRIEPVGKKLIINSFPSISVTASKHPFSTIKSSSVSSYSFNRSSSYYKYAGLRP